jgi:DNA-directed RNA polymerase I, II, and III subunit RPABC2
MNALEIAELELKQKAIPYFVRRFLPDGQYEDWKISELEIIE